jgi:mono/diheme cytochrome c family protein
MLIATALAIGLVGATDASHSGRDSRHVSAPRTGEQIYRAACAGCHGADGSGAPQTTVGFAVPLPDFADCNFASREQRTDWAAIVRDGGPVRGFSRIMPAFRDALTPEEIQRVIAYLKSFCQSRDWPQGDFNLPRPMVTEKAFPEDETILTSSVAASGPGSVANALVLERRFGSRAQIDFAAPFSFLHREPGGSWIGGIGDLSIGLKYTFIHNLASGTILSGLGEVAVPTGNSSSGFGTGTTVIEPSILLGQLLPAKGFFQFQGGFGLSTNQDRTAHEAFWSGVLGTTRSVGPISRIVSPMVEVTGTRELTAGAPAEWDVIPQVQISLSARQHVLASVGVRVPFANTTDRHTQLVAYILWDWFDGGLLEGWKGWCPGCQH